MGDGSEFEASLVKCLTEHCRDVRDAQMRKGFSFFTKDKADEEEAVTTEEGFSVDMPRMLEKIVTVVQQTSGEKGYAVGKQTSYADVAIFALIADCTMKDDTKDALKAADKCAELKAIVSRVGADDRVKKWLQKRPTSNF